jgi:hypothetical protein
LLLFPKTPEIIKWSVTGYLFLSPFIRRHVASCSHLHCLRWSRSLPILPWKIPLPIQVIQKPFWIIDSKLYFGVKIWIIHTPEVKKCS